MTDATSGEDAGPSVFVSYSRDDREQVVPIIKSLEENGHTVWWDGLLKGGDRFSHVTETALETCKTVLVVWTKTSINSHWVRDEATRGRDRGCMLSVSLDGTEPPIGFRQIQYVDLSGTRDHVSHPRFSEVLEALDNSDGMAGSDLTFAPPKAKPPAVSRRGAIAIGGIGVLAAGGAIAAWQGGLFSPQGQPNSIAVMTFENLSNDPEQEYFSAGISEELRSILSLNRQLSVAAQTSSDKFADSEETASAIASALGVANVLEGSVRRAGDQLRIAVRLIDGATDLNLWSDVFDRQMDDVLATQREIATIVVDSLVTTISDGAGTTRVGGTDSPQALDAYLKGVSLYANSGAREAGDRAALAELDRAIEIDPGYAAAHAERSRVLVAIGNRHAAAEELDAYYQRGMDAAQRSIELAPDLAEGHSSLGSVLANGRLDMAAARQPAERAFELGYGNPTVLRRFTVFASYVGAFEQGREAIARAIRLDPLNGSVFREEAVLEFAAHDFVRAAAAARQALSLEPEASIVNRILGDIARFEGQLDEARDFYEQEPSVLSKLPSLAMLEARAGNTDAAQRYFDEMIERYGDNSLYQQAQVYAQWGETETALRTLERAYEVGDSGLVLSHTDQNLDPIRQTQEFGSLQRRLGFE